MNNNEHINGKQTLHLWLEGKKPKTQKEYKRDINLFLEYLDAPLSTATREDFFGFLDVMEGEGLATRTIQRRLAALKSYYAWLYGVGEIQRNPAHGVKYKNEVPAEVKVITEQELFLAISKAENKRDALAAWVMFQCFTSSEETLRLKKDDFFVDCNGKHQVLIRKWGKKKERVLQITEGLFCFAKSIDTAGERLFVSRKKNILSHVQFWRVINKMFSDIGLPFVKPKTLWQSGIAHAVRSEKSVYWVLKRTGRPSLDFLVKYVEAIIESETNGERNCITVNRPNSFLPSSPNPNGAPCP